MTFANRAAVYINLFQMIGYMKKNGLTETEIIKMFWDAIIESKLATPPTPPSAS